MEEIVISTFEFINLIFRLFEVLCCRWIDFESAPLVYDHFNSGLPSGYFHSDPDLRSRRSLPSGTRDHVIVDMSHIE